MRHETPELSLELVSVVIPCYKQAHFLGEAIESVLAQTYPAQEIIVVDDGSPDETKEVSIRYPSIKYVRQTNQGLSAARNTGYRNSRGMYLVFLDADDRLLPHHLSTCIKAFQRRPDAAFVCGDYRFLGDDQAAHRHDCRPQPDLYGTLLRSNFIGPPHTVMFRRDAIVQSGGFIPGMKVVKIKRSTCALLAQRRSTVITKSLLNIGVTGIKCPRNGKLCCRLLWRCYRTNGDTSQGALNTKRHWRPVSVSGKICMARRSPGRW